MDRRWALGALWALFAAASVGVGFGAAGLVGDPFSDPGPGLTAASSGSVSVPVSTPTPRGTGPSATPSGPSTGPTSTGPVDVVRGVTTRAGFVSGSCGGGLVVVSASPAVGWAIDDVDGGRREEARVRFEATGEGDGRVEVTARCVAGVPVFAVENQDRGGGSSGSGGSGGSGGDG
jgi:hypothetical protein